MLGSNADVMHSRDASPLEVAMPTIYTGNEVGSSKYLNYVWTRSPRSSERELVLRSNAVTRTAASVVWHDSYKSQPSALYLVRRNSTQEYRGEFGSSVYARAYAKVREAAWGDVQASLAVDYAERGATFLMLGQTLGRLVKAVLAVKRGRFGDAARHLATSEPRGVSVRKAFADNWLAYRLGWTPFMGSVDSLLQIIDSPLSYTYRFVRGSSTLPFKKTLKAGGYSYWHDVELAGTYRVVIKGKVEVSDPDLARLNQYGLLNPLGVAWELVPFSFMVDRVIKVGDYLGSFTDFVGLSFKDLSITDGITSSERWTVARPGWMPVGDVHVKALIKRKTRVLSASIPMPQIQFGKGLLANATYAADAAALLSNLLRRK